jgi:hypothetical protein
MGVLIPRLRLAPRRVCWWLRPAFTRAFLSGWFYGFSLTSLGGPGLQRWAGLGLGKVLVLFDRGWAGFRELASPEAQDFREQSFPLGGALRRGVRRCDRG